MPFLPERNILGYCAATGRAKSGLATRCYRFYPSSLCPLLQKSSSEYQSAYRILFEALDSHFENLHLQKFCEVLIPCNLHPKNLDE